MPEIRIGTSGYSFPDWVGPYYPPGTKSREMLARYARDFDTVEINATYYRPPTEKAMAGMVERTPEGFSFFVKAHQDFTHQGDLSGSAAFRAALEPMRAAGRLSGLLFQFPQSFKNNEANRRHLAEVARAFPEETAAVEFRDSSWATEAVYRYLETLRLSLVSVDEPETSTLFPRVARATGAVGYLRFHSRDAGKWYAGGAARYDYRYSDEELGEWLPKLRELAERASRIRVYFNNCFRARAVENARRMKELLKQVDLWKPPA